MIFNQGIYYFNLFSSNNLWYSLFINYFHRGVSIDTQSAPPPTKYTNAPSLDPIEAGCGPKPWVLNCKSLMIYF